MKIVRTWVVLKIVAAVGVKRGVDEDGGGGTI